MLLNLKVLQVLDSVMCLLKHLGVDDMFAKIAPFVGSRVASHATVTIVLLCMVAIELMRGDRWRL